MTRTLTSLLLLYLLAGSALALPGGGDSETANVGKDVPKAVLDSARSFIFEIEVTFEEFSKSKAKEEEQYYGYGPINDVARGMSADKRIFRFSALLYDTSGLLLTVDPDLNYERVKKMEAVGSSGKKYPVNFVGILKNKDIAIFKMQSFREKVAAPKMNFRDPGTKGEFYLVRQLRVRDVLMLDAMQVQPRALSAAEVDSIVVYPLGDNTGSWEMGADDYSSHSVVLNADGTVCFVPTSGTLMWDIKRGTRNYLHKWPKPEDILGAEELTALLEKTQKYVDDATCNLKIRFRQDEKSQYRYYRPDEEDIGKEWRVYGLPVSPGRIFVPHDAELEKIEKIESISLMKDGKEEKCRFAGLYKEFGGFMVETDIELSPPKTIFTSPAIRDLEIFLDASVKYRAGRKDILVKYNRFDGIHKGYKDTIFRTSVRPFLKGAFVLSLSGSLTGFVTDAKRYENIETDGDRHGSGGWCAQFVRYLGLASGGSPYYEFSGLRDRFDKPEDHFDPRARVRSIKEEKKIVWLGVEFQKVTADIAKYNKIEKETRNGKFGLIVTTVYDNSPVARIGLKPGDLLLKLKEEGKAGEIVFGEDWYDSGYRGYGDYYYMRQMGRSPIGKNWFTRQNNLTQALTKMGPGTKIVLTYSQDHKEKTASLVLEESPVDLNSTDKYENETIGLTVKDITYEVRHILRLDDDFTGVITYKVDPGSSASRGQIMPMEFIQKIDNKPVASIDEFREKIEGLIEKKVKTAKFTITLVGSSRIVDVKLEKSEIKMEDQLPIPRMPQ